MSLNAEQLNFSDIYMAKVAQTLKEIKKVPKGYSGSLKTGLDLGTAYIVLVVLDENNQPLGTVLEFAQVIKDGLLLDFTECQKILQKLKNVLEDSLEVKLSKTAIAMPPGIYNRAHLYVAESVGLNVTNVLDEPVAANLVLGIQNGAIVDIGGGTTGVAIFNEGKLIHTFDEPTGGVHLSLVIQGNKKITFPEAEALKKDPKVQKELLPIVTPVIQKMGTIISKGIKNYQVDNLYLVGGTCLFNGFAEILRQETNLPVSVPKDPFLVTPAGIAQACLV